MTEDSTGRISGAASFTPRCLESRQIVDGLSGILDDIENGRLAFSDAYEDIHSFVEANLIDRIGDAGKKLHTGRSRNDQVALDMKMYIRDEIGEISGLLRHFLQTLLSVMEENKETFMPGFTHLQKAQPVTLAHHRSGWICVRLAPAHWPVRPTRLTGTSRPESLALTAPAGTRWTACLTEIT